MVKGLSLIEAGPKCSVTLISYSSLAQTTISCFPTWGHPIWPTGFCWRRFVSVLTITSVLRSSDGRSASAMAWWDQRPIEAHPSTLEYVPRKQGGSDYVHTRLVSHRPCGPGESETYKPDWDMLVEQSAYCAWKIAEQAAAVLSDSLTPRNIAIIVGSMHRLVLVARNPELPRDCHLVLYCDPSHWTEKSSILPILWCLNLTIPISVAENVPKSPSATFRQQLRFLPAATLVPWKWMSPHVSRDAETCPVVPFWWEEMLLDLRHGISGDFMGCFHCSCAGWCPQ
jgi:hypothetical protein